MIRLQKYLASCGVSSRRKSEEFITQGKVTVNKKTVTEMGTKINPEKDVVALSGKILKPQEPALYLFYKPKSVVTTLSDPQNRATIKDFLKGFKTRLFPVGRLDYDVQGLLLLTNDGDYTNQLLHPRFAAERTYLAYVAGSVDSAVIKNLKKGFQLKDGIAKAKSARIVSAEELVRYPYFKLPKNREGSLVEIVATEGRKHFIKRLLAASGHPVIELCRTSYDQYKLGKMRPGEIKEAKRL